MPDSAQPNLALLTAGFGCLSCTFVAGALLVRKRLLPPTGSVTQVPAPGLGCGGRTLSDVIGLTPPANLVFGGWSIYPESMSNIVALLGLVSPAHFQVIRPELREIQPLEAYYDPTSPVEPIDGTYVKKFRTKAEYARALREDILSFQRKHACPHAVVLWCGNTERLAAGSSVFETLESFENGLEINHPDITSSQVYAWAAVQAGAPFAAASPNHCVGFPALEELAARTGTPLAGEEFLSASPLLVERVTNQPAPGPHPSWWQGRDDELLDYTPPSGAYADVVAERRAAMPLLESRRTAPAILDVVFLLDWARRRGMHGLQPWLDPYFRYPIGAARLAASLAGFVAETTKESI